MSIIIGIDVGGSTTKIVGMRDGTMLQPLLVRADDALTSVYGAFGKLLSENKLSLHDIERVMITGTGNSYVEGPLYDLSTYRVNEFQAIGKGGLTLSGMDKALIVSMGTGTAFVLAEGDDWTHLGGTGVGGGTLLGLGYELLHVRGFDAVMEMALQGDCHKVDLRIGDISIGESTGLPPDITASNFGKIEDMATKNDTAAGIVNMVIETIGMTSRFAARSVGIKNIVLIGNLSVSPLGRNIFDRLEVLFDERFVIPENAEFATAIGAAKSPAVE
ncbi:MAG: type II pantothenate kinase [Oscillospiraceae bacterium]|nr:type II pantothenate kinase [Oscillospiraceae bacterium]